MKRLLFLTVVLVVDSTGADAKLPPLSPRAEAAIQRVRPGLEVELEKQGLAWGSAVFIRVFKESRKLEVWVWNQDRYLLFKTYPVCYFSGDLGPKLREGDLQAPEGFYRVTADLMNPWSRFHLSFNLGYPNRFDRAKGRTGGLIMVHGNCVSTGCFAMTDPVIEEIYALVDASLRKGEKSVPVHVFPFRLEQPRLEKEKDHRWIGFWRNLKEGYDYFETHQKPPAVSVLNGRYAFN